MKRISRLQLRKLITEIWPFDATEKPKEINYPQGEEELYDSSQQHMAVRSAIHNLPSLIDKVESKASKLNLKKGIEPDEGIPYLRLANAINDFLQDK